MGAWDGERCVTVCGKLPYFLSLDLRPPAPPLNTRRCGLAPGYLAVRDVQA
jgi:hypothetical protein